MVSTLARGMDGFGLFTSVGGAAQRGVLEPRAHRDLRRRQVPVYEDAVTGLHFAQGVSRGEGAVGDRLGGGVSAVGAFRRGNVSDLFVAEQSAEVFECARV